MKRRLPIAGDFVGFAFGHNETAYAKALRDGESGLVCYDPWFNLEFEAKPVDEPGPTGAWLLLEPDRPVVTEGRSVKSVVQRYNERVASGEFERRKQVGSGAVGEQEQSR